MCQAYRVKHDQIQGLFVCYLKCISESIELGTSRLLSVRNGKDRNLDATS